MRGPKFLFALPLLIFSLLFINTAQTQAAPDGEAIFKQNCTQCHAVSNDVVIGPGLKDVSKRRPKEWLHKWIKNSGAVIKSGDAYAVELYNKFNKTAMPAQNLSDEEIDALLSYIDKKSTEAPAAATAGAPGAPTGEEGTTEESDNTGMILIIGALLISLVYLLTLISNRLAKAVRERNGEPEPVKLKGMSWARENKTIVALSIILLVVVGSVKGWYALSSIGIAQDYQPDQPIAFSHKLHAGEMNIACIYCHSGAEKGKAAGIPSANVCMNCHKFVKEGKVTGKVEIAKIYAALDYDPATQQYGPNQKPIQWVRVHNLPDLAYFNHSQHTKVGGQQCQTCHGPVQEMTVAKQFAPLTMGWCIQCHIETPVKKAGNKYYDNFKPIDFNKYHGTGDTTLTVEKIGGTECSKCHY